MVDDSYYEKLKKEFFFLTLYKEGVMIMHDKKITLKGVNQKKKKKKKKRKRKRKRKEKKKKKKRKNHATPYSHS